LLGNHLPLAVRYFSPVAISKIKLRVAQLPKTFRLVIAKQA